MLTSGKFYFVKFDNSVMTSTTGTIFEGEYLIKVRDIDDDSISIYIAGFGNIIIPESYIEEFELVENHMFNRENIMRARNSDLLKQTLRVVGKGYNIYSLFETHLNVEILTFINGDILFRDDTGIVRIMQSYMCKRIEQKGE